MRIEIPFFTLIDKILPLLSTLLGAFITYYVTVLSKKNEIKVNAQTKARDEYWIPCSMAISNLQKKIAALTKDENCYVSFQGENSCELQTAELLKYLQADKRVFFYERTRNILSLLEKNIQDFENAVDNDVHIVGMSSLAAGHKTLMPQLVEELKKRGREDIMVVIGGVIPAQDYDYLYEHGAAAIFGPGTIIPVCAKKVLEELNRRLAD